jgi:hypothetical protein
MARQNPRSCDFALSVLEHEFDFERQHVVYVDSFLRFLYCTSARRPPVDGDFCIRLLPIFKRILLTPEATSRAKLFATVFSDAFAQLPDDSPAVAHICQDAIDHLSVPGIDSLTIGIALARVCFAHSVYPRSIGGAIRSAILTHIDPTLIERSDFWPLLRKLFTFWRRAVINFFIPYAGEEEILILEAVIGLIARASASSLTITDITLLGLIHGAAKCVQKIAQYTAPYSWRRPDGPLCMQHYTHLFGHVFTPFLGSVVAMAVIVPEMEHRFAISDVILGVLLDHLPASFFKSWVTQGVATAVFHTSVTDRERVEMGDSPVNFWPFGFGHSGVRGKAIRLWNNLWEAGEGLAALERLAPWAALGMAEVLPLLLATGDRLLGDTGADAARVAEMAMPMLADRKSVV